MNYSRLEQFESAIEDAHKVVQAVVGFVCGAALWCAVWWLGDALRWMVA
jgi:hypothetical protein